MKKLYISLALLSLIGTASLLSKKPKETKAEFSAWLGTKLSSSIPVQNDNAYYNLSIDLEYRTNIEVVNNSTIYTFQFDILTIDGSYFNFQTKDIEEFHVESASRKFTVAKEFTNDSIQNEWMNTFIFINSITPYTNENDINLIKFNMQLIQEVDTLTESTDVGLSFELNIEEDEWETKSSNNTNNFINFNRYTSQITSNWLETQGYIILNTSKVNTALIQYGKDEVINNPNDYGLLTPSQAENLQGAEIIDIPGMMFNILTMPFTFISQAFDVTLFEGTIYQLNISNLIKSVIAVLTILFIFHLFTNGFDAVSNLNKNINTKVDSVSKQTRSNNKANKSKPVKKEE